MANNGPSKPAGERKAASLAQLRARIDTIDEEMHRLLIERSSIIDSLISVKNTKATGAAFRPAREADIMRRLVARHKGTMPLSALEHIWREIISTFTWLQAPFHIHLDAGGDPVAMRDLARYQFGFTVSMTDYAGPGAVVEAVEASQADLGLIRIDQEADAPAWWEALNEENGAMIISRLPIIEATASASDLPALVLSKPLNDRVKPEITCYAVRWSGETGPDRADVDLLTATFAGEAKSGLIAASAEEAESDIRARIESHGCLLQDMRSVGGYAAPSST